MLYLSEAQVRELLGPPDMMDLAISRLERAFQSLSAGTAANEPRRRVRAPAGLRGGAMLHLMGAGDSQSGYIGCKAYSTSRGGAFFFVLLFDAANGRPLALIEADYLGQMRTGAASGLATKYMARRDAGILGVIGSGGQAFTQVQAVAAVQQLKEVRVHSRNPQRREQFAVRLNAELGLNVRACDTTEETVAGAFIVVTATTSSQPVFLENWIEPGMHINAIGGNAVSRREVDEQTVRRASRIVVDSLEQSRMESGELIAAFQEDYSDGWERVVELSQVVAGKTPGRGSAEEVTLFKSNGIALEDIALAGWIYEQSKS